MYYIGVYHSSTIYQLHNDKLYDFGKNQQFRSYYDDRYRLIQPLYIIILDDVKKLCRIIAAKINDDNNLEIHTVMLNDHKIPGVFTKIICDETHLLLYRNGVLYHTTPLVDYQNFINILQQL